MLESFFKYDILVYDQQGDYRTSKSQYYKILPLGLHPIRPRRISSPFGFDNEPLNITIQPSIHTKFRIHINLNFRSASQRNNKFPRPTHRLENAV